jgi:hypothetical protein
MLVNLVIALRARGRHAEAGRVGRRALELRPDGTTANHAVWVSLDEAIEGDVAAAETRLAALDAKALDVTHRYLRAIVQAVLTMRRSDAATRAGAFAEARRQLSEAARAVPSLPRDDRPAVAAAYHRCVRCIASARGGLAWLWAWWRNVAPLVPKATKPQA